MTSVRKLRWKKENNKGISKLVDSDSFLVDGISGDQKPKTNNQKPRTNESIKNSNSGKCR